MPFSRKRTNNFPALPPGYSQPGEATGFPVSQSLTVDSAADALVRPAITAIDDVHGVRTLVATSVTTSTSLGAGVKATVNMRIPGAPTQAAKITMNPTGNTPLMTFAHEVGHVLDRYGIASDETVGGSFASMDPNHAAMQKVVQATMTTPLYQKSLAKMNDTDMPASTVSHLQYMLSPDEVWARTYGQYIAVHSGESDMMQELSSMQAASTDYPYAIPGDQFQPVDNAITKLMKGEGWQK